MTSGKHVRSEFIPKNKKMDMAELSPYFDLLRTYHPDEQYIIKILANMAKKKEFQPSSFIYGPFFFYQIGSGIFAAKLMGLTPAQTDIVYFMKKPGAFAPIYLGGRFAVAVIGVLAVVVVFLIGIELGGIMSGFLAALMLSSIPLFNMAGKFIKPDMPCLLWSGCVLLFSIYAYKHGRLRDYILAGVFVAFAAGSKYPGILSCFYVAAYFLARNYDFSKKVKCNLETVIKGKEFKYLIVSGLACIFAFIITNPSCILSYEVFNKDVNWIAGVLRKGNFFVNLFDFLVCFLYDGFFYTIGPIMLLLMLGGIVFVLRKPNKIYWSMLPVVACFVIMASRGRPGSDAYLLPLFVPVCLISAHLLMQVKNKTLRISIAALAIVTSFLLTSAYDNIANKENARLTATKWINQNIPESASVSRLQYPVSYRTAMISPEAYIQYSQDMQPEKAKLADYFIDCSFEWEGASWDKRFSKDYQPSIPPSDKFIEIKRIENIPMFLGIIPLKRHYMLNSYMETVSPRIVIYKRALTEK